MKKLYLLLIISSLHLALRAQTLYVKGDANHDGRVTMADATMAAQAYLGGNPEGLNVQAADIDGDGKVTVVDANAIVNMALTGINGHEYVEIGGIKWATMNVGATTVAGSCKSCYGDYYAWSDTKLHYTSMELTSDSTATFKWLNYSGYRTMPSYSEAELDAEHDIATLLWGDGWRTPTNVEMLALIEACTGSKNPRSPKQLTGPVTEGGIYAIPSNQSFLPEYSGVAGCLFVDRQDIAKRVFFPLAGYVDGTVLKKAGQYMRTWASTHLTSNTNAYAMAFTPASVTAYTNNSCSDGLTVRPVSGPRLGSTPIEFIAVDSIESIKVGETHTLAATVLPRNATYYIVEWQTSDPSIATVTNGSGIHTTITALKPGIVTITCRAKDGSGVEGKCRIEIKPAKKYTKSIKLEVNEMVITKGRTVEISSCIMPETDQDPPCRWESSDTTIVYVQPFYNMNTEKGTQSTVRFTARNAGYAVVRCVSLDNPNVMDSCVVQVFYNMCPVFDDHECVYIGNALWATTNLGAWNQALSYDACFGDYYALGELTTRYNTITRNYNGTVFADSWKTEYPNGYTGRGCSQPLTYDDLDVAHQQWGHSWRLPTPDNIDSLICACIDNPNEITITPLTGIVKTNGIYYLDKNQKYEADYTGIEGILFVERRRHNKLFFPFTGSFNGKEHAPLETYYLVNWAGENNGETLSIAFRLNKNTVSKSIINSSRGCAVRPVYSFFK